MNPFSVTHNDPAAFWKAFAANYHQMFTDAIGERGLPIGVTPLYEPRTSRLEDRV